MFPNLLLYHECVEINIEYPIFLLVKTRKATELEVGIGNNTELNFLGHEELIVIKNNLPASLMRESCSNFLCTKFMMFLSKCNVLDIDCLCFLKCQL